MHLSQRRRGAERTKVLCYRRQEGETLDCEDMKGEERKWVGAAHRYFKDEDRQRVK